MTENIDQTEKTFARIGRFGAKVLGVEPLIEQRAGENLTKKDIEAAFLQHMAPTLSNTVAQMEKIKNPVTKSAALVGAALLDLAGVIATLATENLGDYLLVRISINAAVNGLFELIPQLQQRLK